MKRGAGTASPVSIKEQEADQEASDRRGPERRGTEERIELEKGAWADIDFKKKRESQTGQGSREGGEKTAEKGRSDKEEPKAVGFIALVTPPTKRKKERTSP